MAMEKSNRPSVSRDKKEADFRWPEWYAELLRFRDPQSLTSTWQLINTIIPYFLLWYLMILTIQSGYPYVFTLILTPLASAFLVRTFILFHDCAHGAFFRSRRANIFFGYLLGVLVFTSFEDWRFIHLKHHGTYANLDARGFGDIWTMTLTEYENSSSFKQLLYRLYRNPLVLVGLGALFNFLLHNRLPDFQARRKERIGVILTNLILLAIALSAAKIIGWRAYLLIQLPVLFLAGAAGIWLFYVQHQFEGGYWARKAEWEPLRAAMEGSSFFQLPTILAWFSGDIGYHHIHHLNPRIPNYQLKNCYDTITPLQSIQPVTLKQSLSCFGLKLWNESSQKMVSYP
jgi:acyl-lipid omega-6 desaturase (Delta-12 desaturase)